MWQLRGRHFTFHRREPSEGGENLEPRSLNAKDPSALVRMDRSHVWRCPDSDTLMLNTTSDGLDSRLEASFGVTLCC